jgi:hypothetical protein
MSYRRLVAAGRHSNPPGAQALAGALVLLVASVCAAQEPPALPAPSAVSVSEAPTPAAPLPERQVDIHIDDARKLLSSERWEEMLAAQPDEDDSSSDLPELGGADVEVEGERVAPRVPSGIAGLFWALRHPTQAWRLFAPAQ